LLFWSANLAIFIGPQFRALPVYSLSHEMQHFSGGSVRSSRKNGHHLSLEILYLHGAALVTYLVTVAMTTCVLPTQSMQ
jgi:hypothetical protein